MKGHRSEEEKTKLGKEIDALTEELEKNKKDLQLLTTSNKQLLDECRNIDRVIVKVKKD